MIHKLKTWTPYYEVVINGKKKFEKRKWDRDYKVNDILLLQEWNPGTGYTGREIPVLITYILEGEFSNPGVCLMSIDGVD
jgi:hypothetical protein